MATKTASDATAGWVPQGFVFGVAKRMDGVAADPQTDTNNANTDVNSIHSTAGTILKVFHITAISDNDELTYEFPILSISWQAEDADDDRCSVYCNPATGAAGGGTGSRDRYSTTVRFSTAGTPSGWIWCLCNT